MLARMERKNRKKEEILTVELNRASQNKNENEIKKKIESRRPTVMMMIYIFYAYARTHKHFDQSPKLECCSTLGRVI